MWRILLLLVPCSAFSGCQASSSAARGPGASVPRLSDSMAIKFVGAVADDYEVEQSLLGVSGSADVDSVDANALQFEFWTGESGSGVLELGNRDYEVGPDNIDAFDIMVGGRYYPDTKSIVRPYLGAGLRTELLELDRSGADLGAQLGLNLMLGGALLLGDHFLVDLGADYVVPLAAGEDDLGLVDTELEGYVLRLGIGFRF